jgi:hypothetical protein
MEEFVSVDIEPTVEIRIDESGFAPVLKKIQIITQIWT